MDRLPSTVLLVLTLAGEAALPVGAADQLTSGLAGTTHGPSSLPQGKRDTLSLAGSLSRTAHEHTNSWISILMHSLK